MQFIAPNMQKIRNLIDEYERLILLKIMVNRKNIPTKIAKVQRLYIYKIKFTVMETVCAGGL